MAIVISTVSIQQKVSGILDSLVTDDANDRLSLADEAYHKLLSLYELLKHAIASTPRDALELSDILKMLEHAMQQVESRFDEAVDQLYPAMVTSVPRHQPLSREGPNREQQQRQPPESCPTTRR